MSKCGHDMGKRAKCLRCGYTVHDIIAVDPEKIESEESENPKTERRVVNPDDVHVSRSGGSIFGDIFGGGIFGDILGSIFGGFAGYDDGSRGYDYDPKYYDDFGNPIELPDEFERESVVIDDVECIEESPQKKENRAESRSESPESRRNRHTRESERKTAAPQDHRAKMHPRRRPLHPRKKRKD